MKLTIAYLRTFHDATAEQIDAAIGELADRDPVAAGEDRLLRIDRQAEHGGFVQLTPHGNTGHWHVDFCSGDEADIRSLREPIRLADAIDMLRRFLAGEPGLAVDGDWRDLDPPATSSHARVAALCLIAVALFALLIQLR